MRRLRLLCVLMLVCVMMPFSVFIGCSSEQEPPVTDTEVTVGDDMTTDTEDKEQTIVGSIGAGDYIYKVKFYSIDFSKMNLVGSVSAISSSEPIVPLQVLEPVKDSLEDNSVLISYNDAYVEDGYYIIDFSSSIRSVSESDPLLEELILDASAQTILDNFEDCRGVKVTIDGQAYKTEGFSFDKEYIYMDD